MNKLFLLGIIAILVVSGCAAKGQPSDSHSHVHADGANQAAAGSPNEAAANTASAQEAAKPTEAAPGAAERAETTAKSEPGKSGQAGFEAATKPDAKHPGASPVASEAGPEPTAAAVGPSATATANQPADTAAEPAKQSQQEPVSAASSENTELKISITGDAKHGVIVKETSVPFQEGMTVMDVLKQVTKGNKIQMEYKGKGTYAYVQGIDNLYEFDGGPKSGWVYKVNDIAPGVGAGSYKVTAGDKIEWLYTLDLGKDVGAAMK